MARQSIFHVADEVHSLFARKCWETGDIDGAMAHEAAAAPMNVLTPRTRGIIAALYGADWSIYKIAKRMGLTFSAVNTIQLQHLGQMSLYGREKL